MSRSAVETFTGAVVLAAAIGFAGYALSAAGGIGGGKHYKLNASFRSLEGIGEGTDVRLAGVKIGAVSKVALNGETYRADTVVEIRKDVDIPDDSAIVVASEGLLGGNFIEIVPGGSAFFFEPGETFQDTQGAVSLISLLLKFVSGGSEE
ncbi:MAG: outer membrane lipid asymmetry maintenance protein MlaD [Sulfitobacter sp.]